MIVGADVNAIVTSTMIQTAQTQTGQTIRFWGRYFKDAGNESPEQYQPEEEAALLNQRNIRVLPVARQTNHVNGSKAQGQDDGETNASAIVAGFGATTLAAMPSGLLVFLDVEGPPHASLSANYYTGWSAGLVQKAQSAGVTLIPGVYGAQGDNQTWAQLVSAIDGGAQCAGIWSARPVTMGCHPLHPFDEHLARPRHLPNSVKILILQAVQECHNLDFNVLNPAFEDDTLAKLVLPVPVPANAAVA
jgi:hypothetical protein